MDSNTTHACDAVDVEHPCAVPCLLAEESTRMRHVTLHNGRVDGNSGEKNC